MRLFRAWILRLAGFFRRESWEQDLETEIKTNLELHVEDNIRAGMTPQEARRAARIRFGSITAAKNQYRDRKVIPSLRDLIGDIRYSARSLRRAPGLSFAVIATLALCIGANTAMFSLLYDLILKPLPFKGSDRIVHVYNAFPGETIPDSRAGWSQYVDFNEQADFFEGFILSKSGTKIREGTQIRFLGVTSDFFDFLGVQPLLGRFFTPEEVDPGPGMVMVLSQTAWENDYLADPNVLGQEVRFLNEQPYTIVGVAPRSMEALDSTVRFFTPFSVDATALNPANRYAAPTDLWGRLKPGVSHEQAYKQLVAVERRAIEQHSSPRHLEFFDQNPKPFEIGRPHPLESTLMLLQIGTLFLVLVGCVNVVNLLLARSLRRSPELSIRYSFGAGRITLIRMMLIESLLLASGGMLAGSLLAWSGLMAINRYLAVLFPTAQPVSLSAAMFFSTLSIATAVALVTGLLPITLLWRSGRIQKMDHRVRGASAGSQARLLSNGLVVMQVAVTVTLVIGAGLLIRSFRNVLDVNPGFDASQVVVGKVDFSSFYRDTHSRFDLRRRTMEAMRAIPGVEHASFDLGVLSVVGTHVNRDSVTIRGGSSNGEAEPRAVLKHVDGEYFATMGINILEGRPFRYGEAECEEGPGPVRTSFVVDESFAHLHLNDRSVMGAELVRGGTPPSTDDGWMRVVGVAARANLEGLEKRDGLPVLYICAGEYSDPRFTILVRTKRSSAGVIRDMRATLRQIDPRLHLYDATSLDIPFDNLLLSRQGTALLTGIFAGLALLLSAIGVYGVLSYDVQQRRHEIGIRSAIGASPRQILTLVLQQGLSKTGLGLIMGLAGSMYLNRFLESQLFDITALDTATYAVALVVLLLTAFLATYLPAQRAVRVDPVESLRRE